MKQPIYSQGDAFIAFYAVNDRASFEAIPYFYQTICELKKQKPFAFVLVAHKTDLNSSDWKVSSQEGNDLAHSLQGLFFESSAKEGNINPIVYKTLREVFLIECHL
jgi:hypothetical protein